MHTFQYAMHDNVRDNNKEQTTDAFLMKLIKIGLLLHGSCSFVQWTPWKSIYIGSVSEEIIGQLDAKTFHIDYTNGIYWNSIEYLLELEFACSKLV